MQADSHTGAARRKTARATGMSKLNVPDSGLDIGSGRVMPVTVVLCIFGKAPKYTQGLYALLDKLSGINSPVVVAHDDSVPSTMPARLLRNYEGVLNIRVVRMETSRVGTSSEARASWRLDLMAGGCGAGRFLAMDVDATDHSMCISTLRHVRGLPTRDCDCVQYRACHGREWWALDSFPQFKFAIACDMTEVVFEVHTPTAWNRLLEGMYREVGVHASAAELLCAIVGGGDPEDVRPVEHDREAGFGVDEMYMTLFIERARSSRALRVFQLQQQQHERRGLRPRQPPKICLVPRIIQ